MYSNDLTMEFLRKCSAKWLEIHWFLDLYPFTIVSTVYVKKTKIQKKQITVQKCQHLNKFIYLFPQIRSIASRIDPCHLAWLIRDNRKRLCQAYIENAKCSNGTELNQKRIKLFSAMREKSTSRIYMAGNLNRLVGGLMS